MPKINPFETVMGIAAVLALIILVISARRSLSWHKKISTIQVVQVYRKTPIRGNRMQGTWYEASFVEPPGRWDCVKFMRIVSKDYYDRVKEGEEVKNPNQGQVIKWWEPGDPFADYLPQKPRY